ncbi:ParB/RepB/Spo0J family partition protein [Gemmata sp. G18]|uniref:ParB/RepB/Spo0J family partition protein n=1 Tax=Gemmata palustris TaxID=2822762 RepID=A0ABS5BMK0_9BACT|nr:ParB/RepB/Spo0J family partition protein [Gemmata palustris]MBP3954959.1 ParB/RepB/Spo0J family partition protein [Gemmata palustris]
MNTTQIEAADIALNKEFKGMTFPISSAHPAANLFPWIEDVPLQELADSIAVNGQEEVILRLPDGRIIDGRNRELACRIAGVEPRYSTVDMSEEDVLRLIVAKNIHRRNLSESQRAMIAAELTNLRPGRPKTNGTQVPITRSEVAQHFEVSRKSVQRAANVRENAPELVEPIREGRLDVTTADRVVKLPAQERKQIATAVDPKAEAAAALKRSSGESPKPNAAEESPVIGTQVPITQPMGFVVVKDAKGRTVPFKLALAFQESRAFVANLRANHTEWLEAIRRNGERNGWGAGLTPMIPNLEDDYKTFAQDVASAVPYCVCPHVNAAGEHHPGGKCKVCVANCGWLSRHNWHTLGDSVKKLIDEWGVHPEATASEPPPIVTPAPSKPRGRIVSSDRGGVS